MESDTVSFQSALKFVSGECPNVCRFCFVPNDLEVVSLQDPVKVSRPHMEENLSILEMLSKLGIPEEPLLPQSMCGQCATATITSYIFYTNCQYASNKWHEVIQSLEDCLSKLHTVNPSSKTAYLVIDGEQKAVVTCRKIVGKHKTAAAMKLRQLLDKKHEESNCVSNCICAVCGAQFRSTFYLNKHIKKHNINNKQHETTCQQCLRHFRTQVQLQEHVERVHCPKTIKCPQCTQKFASQRMVKNHERLHHQPAVCKLCLLEFSSRKDLRQHSDKHQANKCTGCEKIFQNRQCYKLHLKICGKRDRDPSYFCDICQKGYLRKNSLRTHLKIDHGFGKTYDCSWCKKKFDALSTLKNHSVTHTKERNFYCECCGGKFVTQAALTYHVRLHTGEKPYPCDLCDEYFLSTSRRAEHRRRKHIGPQLECSVCQMKFVTKHQLFKHKGRHNNPQSKLYVPLIP